MEKVQFTLDTGEAVDFAVLEETKINGCHYLLVTESEEEEADAEAYILKKIEEENTDILYEMVEDEKELDYVSKIFAELLEDVNIEI
jgi:hypothetical protein